MRSGAAPSRAMAPEASPHGFFSRHAVITKAPRARRVKVASHSGGQAGKTRSTGSPAGAERSIRKLIESGSGCARWSSSSTAITSSSGVATTRAVTPRPASVAIASVDGEVLRTVLRGEHVLPRPAEFDINKTTTTHVVGVALGKTVRRGADRLHVDAVDLEFQRRRRCPHQRAHPAVANGQPVLAALDRRRVIEVRARDQRAPFGLARRRMQGHGQAADTRGRKTTKQVHGVGPSRSVRRLAHNRHRTYMDKILRGLTA